jgi:CHASE2 domain-containing sensor protein
VPRDEAASVLDAAQRKSQAEQVTLRQIAEGRLDTAWIDQTLVRIGFKG